MINFFILLPTYNRPSLLTRATHSLQSQTYPYFKALIIDNGCAQPVRQLLEPWIDSRFSFLRLQKNTRNFDEGVWTTYMGGCSHFLFLGDDDVLVPHALEVVAGVFRKDPSIEMLGVRLTYFDHGAGSYYSPDELANCTGNMEDWDGVQVLLYHCNCWGIGAQQSYSRHPSAHPSGTFISIPLIERTRKRQGKLLIEHLGDVGYLGACLNTQRVYHLDLPLTVVGTGVPRDSDAMAAGQRHRIQIEPKSLPYTHLRGISFNNLAVDTHLRVIYLNAFNTRCDCRLRPDFYFRHLREILSDSPWTWVTWRDVIECLPDLFISLYRFLTVRDVLDGSIRLLRGLGQRLFRWPWRMARRSTKSVLRHLGLMNPTQPVITPNQAPVSRRFTDINAFAEWLDNTYVLPSLVIGLTGRESGSEFRSLNVPGKPNTSHEQDI